ncbi:hypothetical protein BU17DRAFT_87236 [Hysterangium stoloniferum]|nr:hypothetical protein BU17DRAFT_87236 [Hysterangium stoloniferum]
MSLDSEYKKLISEPAIQRGTSGYEPPSQATHPSRSNPEPDVNISTPATSTDEDPIPSKYDAASKSRTKRFPKEFSLDRSGRRRLPPGWILQYTLNGNHPFYYDYFRYKTTPSWFPPMPENWHSKPPEKGNKKAPMTYWMSEDPEIQYSGLPDIVDPHVELGPLPDNWSYCFDGRVLYYIELTTKVTTYYDPRIGSGSRWDLGALPNGWGMRLASTGKVYFYHPKVKFTEIDPRSSRLAGT